MSTLNIFKPLVAVLINPFHATDLFRYPLKTWLSDVFRGYQKRSVVEKMLENLFTQISDKLFKSEPSKICGRNFKIFEVMSKLAFICRKLTLETLVQCVKYVQSQQETHWKKVSNIFHVNNKHTRTTSLKSFRCF